MSRIVRALALAATLIASGLVVVGAAAPATAAGTPDITMSKEQPGEVLLGEDIPVTLTVANSTGTNGFNTTIRDVLPEGVSYVAGSATPNPTQFPQLDGTTVLVWENLFDSLAGTTEEFTYSVATDATYDVFAPNNTVTNSAEAYTNSDPRIVPKPDATGTVSRFTGNDTASATTTLIPFRIVKSEPSEEQELLRGVHDHQTVFTLTVENNFVNGSTDFSVVDFVPAGMEFLGCGLGDNSVTITNEYSGSGPIPATGPPAGCVLPTSVTTVEVDPDLTGPLPFGVYTRVEWTGLGDLAAGATIELPYVAAIPLFENELFATPPAEHTANLDNNTGLATTETAGEYDLTNLASTTGTYSSAAGTADFTDTDTQDVVVEDISIHKRSSADTFVQGQNVTYTLFVETSEYATSAANVVVTDVLPPLLDYVSASPAPATGPTLAADGTLTLTWNVTDLDTASDTSTITLNTTVRTNYRDGGGNDGPPVSSNDAATNTTSLTGDVTIITAANGSTAVFPLGDESAHTITSSGPFISKEVSEQVASPATLDCTDGTGVSFVPDEAGDYRPGDHVCFRLTVNFPASLDTVSPQVFDVLPDGFSLDTAAANGGWELTGLHNAGTPTFTDLSPILEWDLPDVDAAGNVFQAVIQAVIDDPSQVSDNDLTANLMKFRYRNTAGDVFQERDQANALIAEPVLTLDKGVIEVNGTAVPGAPADGVAVQESDRVTYQVTVANATSENTFDVSVRDTLPPGITCDMVGDGTGGTIPISNGGECIDAADDYIQWDTDDGIDVPAGGSVDLTYDIIVPNGISAGASLVNRAGVRQYDGDSNSGTPFTYVPENNIDTTLTPNTERADDTAEIVTADPTIDKTASSSINSGTQGNDNFEVTIGETVTYTVTVDIPAGLTYRNATIDDDLDAEKDLQAGTVTATLDGNALPVGGVTLDVDDAGNSWEITFPDPYVVAPGADQVVVVTFDAVILDVASNTRDTGTPNRADFDYQDNSGNDRNVNDSVGRRIVEPNIQLEKAENDADDLVAGGDTVDYTVTVSNPDDGSNRVSAAYDTVVVDTVPETLTVLDAPGGAPVADGGSVDDGDAGTPLGTWDAASRTITWMVDMINPTDSVDLGYQVQIADVIAGSSITNTAVATTTSMPGDEPGERTSTSPNAGTNYSDDADATIGVPEYTLTKSGTPDGATIGETITYTVDVTIPAGVLGYDVTVIDDVPAGVTFESLTSVVCVQGVGACSPDITTGTTTLAPASGWTDGDDIAFFLGDLLPGAAGDRAVTIIYVAYVSDVTAADSGSTLTNGAALFWNTTDEITAPPTDVPGPGGFDGSTPESSDDVDTVEPTLTIDKDVAGQNADDDTRRAVPGETLSYTITVENTGAGAAHDVIVSDVPTDDTWAFTDTTPAAPPLTITNTDGDPNGGLAWTIDGPIPAGGTVTITYDLIVPPGYDSSDENPTGPEQTNTADVPSYFGAPEVTRNANPDRDFREYDDVTPDTVTIELDLASIGDLVWFDVNGDGNRDPGEPGIADTTVTVTYLGPDGVVGGGDDEVFTTSTDADGEYLVPDLPGGIYTVDVDETDVDFIPGLDPSFDLDGQTSSPNGFWQGSLGEDQDRRDVDFGYTGTGSIGDTIWFDQNLDGVQNPGEDGLAGIDVTVTWLGPDGDPGGGDDIVYTTTTDVDGNYLVDDLPAGNFTVEVDTTDLPSDYTNVFDPVDDAGPPPTAPLDSRSTVVLAPGEDNRDQDFGYAGNGSIGDTIYLDRDGNGIEDGVDVGLVGVVVELVHFGPDGVAGGGDDSFFSTITDGSGNYLFENLPLGNYEVTVTGGITLVENSDDPDIPPSGSSDAGDSVSTTTLTSAAPDDLDQDFGYFADSVLGDKVWLDLDGDGVVDPGEPGIPNVEIVVTSLALADPITVVTDANGDYIVPNIPDGVYTVAVTTGTLPPGVTQTFDDDGGGDSTSSTTLATSDLDQDFGYRGSGQIGDTIWLDLDGDGTINGDEVGIGGVTVTLTWDGPAGPIEFTTTTDASGNYGFDNLPNGDYTVTVDPTTLPDGLSPTFDADGTGTPNTSDVTLSTGDNVKLDQDFGYNGTGSIGDTVWFDRDGDGVLDPDESGLAGIDLTLTWDGPDGPVDFTTTTGADGSYLFDNLPPGDYTVTVDTTDLPTGMSATFDNDGLNDSTSSLTLADGEDNLDQDFGYNGAGSIGDTIYLDLDGDGSQGPNEPGVPGQTVQLTWASPNGDVVSTTTTDANGNYVFDNLPPADYTITVIGGIVDTATNTADPGADGDSTNSITLGDGEDDLDQDFGYQGNNSIGDIIWYDVDADGVDDGAAAEPRLDGVEVTAVWFGLDGVAGGGDDVTLPTDTTDANGQYLFENLPDGSYSVTVTNGIPSSLDTNSADPDGGADSTSIVTDLGVGSTDPQADLDQDFGYSGSGSIGDTIWLDLDGDGVQDPGEPGIPGAEITLTWAGPDGVLGTADDVVYPSQTTGPDGTYLFDDLPGGDFQVDVSGTPATLFPTGDPDGGGDDTARLTLTNGESNLDQDFGYVGQVIDGVSAGVGDTIWIDLDADGTQDPGEPGVPGVTVTVTSAGADGVLGTADDITIATDTDADGEYLVTGLPAGPTRVVYDAGDLPGGYDPNSDLDGGVLTEATVDLALGDTRLDVDFGIVGDATITGTVWVDSDADGVIDPGEAGIPNVDVEVTWAGPDGPVTFTVTTDENGEWELDQIPPGDWTTQVVLTTVPDGLLPTTPTDGAVTIPLGGTGNVDNGFVPGGSIGDTVFEDPNRNGAQDPGEVGVPGVVIVLIDGDGTEVDRTTTGPDGTYIFDDLPPDLYTVRVLPTSLPDGVMVVVDVADPTADGVTPVQLGPGEDRTDIDFGVDMPSLPTTGSGPAFILMLALLVLISGLALRGGSTRRRSARRTA